MKIEFLLAEADMAIDRNQAVTSGKGKYRADHHAELITVCALLRDRLKESGGQANNKTNNPEQDHAGFAAGIIRAPYNARAAR